MSSNGNGHLGIVPAARDIVRCDVAMLNKYWPEIRVALLQLRQKTAQAQKKAGLGTDTVTWMPEHIRMAVLKGLVGQNTVEMYLVLDGGCNLKGLFVIACPPDEFMQIPLIMHLWMVWTNERGLIERCTDFVDHLARERGCIALQHTSGRQGWFRRNPKGWRLSQFIYRKELV